MALANPFHPEPRPQRVALAGAVRGFHPPHHQPDNGDLPHAVGDEDGSYYGFETACAVRWSG